MDSLNVGQIVTALTGGNGIIWLLVFIIWSGSKRIWVFGREVDDLRRENEEIKIDRNLYRDIAFSSTSMADRATSVAQAATAKLKAP